MNECKEEFQTVQPGVVKMYSCGPTIYDFAHVGNFRAFLTYDVIKRWLLYRGYEVIHVMNLTDVEDKIIKKMKESGTELKELTEFYANAFFQDAQMLNVIPADKYPRATEHISDIVEMIGSLKKQKFAYEIGGSVYFSVDSFKSYGRLVKLDRRKKFDEVEIGNGEMEKKKALVSDADEYDKENPSDFALWKEYKEEDGKVFWESQELSKGRPGWHIECSCMAMKYLGEKLDIHAGGIDLVFPHHENEIAQSEAASGCSPFAQFWMHNGFVNIGGEKMSKSLGNFQTLRQFVKTQQDARAFRYLVVSSQYRSTLNLTDQVVKAAKGAIRRIDALRDRLMTLVETEIETESGTTNVQDVEKVVEKVLHDFVAHMDDDLNTPRASASMFELINSAERMLKSNSLGSDGAQKVLDALDEFNKVFGIFYTCEIYDSAGELRPNADSSAQNVELSKELNELLEARKKAREEKNWTKADEIRDELAAAGFTVKDTKEGPQLIPIEA
eukprot:CAMPEP_0182449410 /NCGR_PEP_ID=MMETSP1172-20130603/34161_1 /TAXON_ID=708627 /ORGANISM="Timspurckia oligopyrenoides, Strain CCMP3278" /LENGTH=499 /DNA_ID=CAMNT_0024646681 /DNA_START=305 /DNA_END=1804 /DNA_ORIENTATION=-